MMQQGSFKRTEKSLANAITGLVGQLTQYVFHYAVRTVFIYYFGKTYLGLNGLFTNILSILNVAELGIGTSITYQLYETIAKGQMEKTMQYLYFYKKIYRYIGCIILMAGLVTLPLLSFIIKDDLGPVNMYVIYLFYLTNSIFSYWFFAYRNAIVVASQEQYKTQRIIYLFNLISSCIQICLIVLCKSIYAFLLIPISTTIVSNIITGILIGKWYPYIRIPVEGKLSKEEVKQVIRNMYALMISKISYIVLNSTDEIILSAFTGIVLVGIYSNYTLIVGAVLTAIATMFVSMTASIGNLHILGTVEKKIKIYRALNFANFWLYGIAFVCLYILLSPFITMWIGSSFVLGELTTAIICFNFLAKGLRQGTNIFLQACGLFQANRLPPVIASTLNIVLSLILVKILTPFQLAIVGVLAGTLLSEFLITWWFDGYLVCKRILFLSPIQYYRKYWEYIFASIAGAVCCKLICSRYQFPIPIVNLLYNGAVCLLVVNIEFYLLYHKTEEFKYIVNVIRKKVINRLIKFM